MRACGHDVGGVSWAASAGGVALRSAHGWLTQAGMGRRGDKHTHPCRGPATDERGGACGSQCWSDASARVDARCDANVDARVAGKRRVGVKKRSSIQDPDAALVAGIAAGDGEAARLLLDRHIHPITALARRMLGDAHEAEDVVQDVFMRVWKHAQRWTPGRARFSTWLHRVAINACYDRLRKRREVVTDAPPERVDAAPTGFDDLHARDVARAVEAALSVLPERQRAAIALCHYQDMSNIDAAAVMEVSVEALESLLSRGRRALRQALVGRRDELLGMDSDSRHDRV